MKFDVYVYKRNGKYVSTIILDSTIDLNVWSTDSAEKYMKDHILHDDEYAIVIRRKNNNG